MGLEGKIRGLRIPKARIFEGAANNIPVFFIQDAVKFPDVVHAIKPEPHNEMPQASAAHDTFWDFVVGTPETAHMIMWLLSDRAIPRSFHLTDCRLFTGTYPRPYRI